MSYEFRPAKRENVPLLIGLAGGTGSGKTYSAMRLAKGLAQGARFAVIDTENGRAMHYADEFEFDAAELHAPFRPEAYADAIEAADKKGYPVIVVDSASHEHAGEGGLLDWHEEELQRLAGDDWKKREAMKFSAWIKPKQAHKRFVNRLLQLNAHLILCFRAEEKIEIVKEKDANGKLKTVVRPKKSLTGLDGWIPISEKNLPYELTLSVLLTAYEPGVPKPIKLQAQHKPMVPLDKPIGEETGVELAQWASGGTAKRTRQPEKADVTENADADVTFENNGDTDALATRLMELATASGKAAAMEGAISANRIAHEDNPEKHKEWLQRQLERADEWAASPA